MLHVRQTRAPDLAAMVLLGEAIGLLQRLGVVGGPVVERSQKVRELVRGLGWDRFGRRRNGQAHDGTASRKSTTWNCAVRLPFHSLTATLPTRSTGPPGKPCSARGPSSKPMQSRSPLPPRRTESLRCPRPTTLGRAEDVTPRSTKFGRPLP